MEITIEFVNGEMIRQEVDEQKFVDAVLSFVKGEVDVRDTRGGKLYNASTSNDYDEIFLPELVKNAGMVWPDVTVNDFKPRVSLAISENPLAWGEAWIVFRLDYGDHEVDENFEWIVTQFSGEGVYKIREIEEPFSIVKENGAVVIDVEGDRYVFNRTHECWPDILLDEGRAIAIGWIDRILKSGDDSSPVYSLLKCPHPYKMIGSQLSNGLANICEALIHAG